MKLPFSIVFIFVFFQHLLINITAVTDWSNSPPSSEHNPSPFTSPNAPKESLSLSSSGTNPSATSSDEEITSKVTKAPGNAQFHEDGYEYRKAKANLHTSLSKFLMKKTPEHRFGLAHKREAKSSYKKAKIHSDFVQKIQSGQIQPGSRSEHVLDLDLPRVPKWKYQAGKMLSDRHLDFIHRRGTSHLVPIYRERTRKRRPEELDTYKYLPQSSSSSFSSYSSSSPSTPQSQPKKKQKFNSSSSSSENSGPSVRHVKITPVKHSPSSSSS